jgi:hypothetical protein
MAETSNSVKYMGRDARQRQYRIPIDLDERLEAEADQRGLAANALVVKLIESGLDRLPPLDAVLGDLAGGRSGGVKAGGPAPASVVGGGSVETDK